MSIDGKHYIGDMHRGRYDYEELKERALAFHAEHPEAWFIIENASAGTSLLRALQKHGCIVRSASSISDKVVRLARVLHVFEEGRVLFNTRADRVERIKCAITELLLFPNCRYNDQVDSIVHAITVMEPLTNPGGKIGRDPQAVESN